MDPHIVHPSAARSSKPSHLTSSKTKTAAGECDLWNGDELGDDLQPLIARALLQLDQIGGLMPGKAGGRGRTSSFGQQTVPSEDRQSFFGHPGFA